jgi:hypothetical protein
MRYGSPDIVDLDAGQSQLPAMRTTWSRSPEGDAAMTAWIALGNGMAGFAVGLFLHAIPGSWWPRWLRELVGKKE